MYHVHAVLHRALRDAVKWGYLQTNVAACADPPRASARHTTWWWTQFFKDSDGNLSATRLVFLACATVFLVVWTWASIDAHKVVDVPNSVATIFLSLMAGKAVQSIGGK